MMGRDDAVVIRIFTVEEAGNEVRAAKGEGDMVFRPGDLDGAALFVRQQADYIRKDAAGNDEASLGACFLRQCDLFGSQAVRIVAAMRKRY